MSMIGIPPAPPNVRSSSTAAANLDYTVLHGLRAAIEALSECSDVQLDKKQKATTTTTKLANRCRVICITSARDNDSMQRLEEIFLSVLQQQNKIAAAAASSSSSPADRLLTIDHCHLVIINTFPSNVESQVNNHPPKNVSRIHVFIKNLYK